ncbi:MAG: Hsp20/alpha crystallin family protein [Lachnospiraceae bacterium]|nr:Hsp20/alpha crystallin family protein [Lachnospiraceae bacterium]
MLVPSIFTSSFDRDFFHDFNEMFRIPDREKASGRTSGLMQADVQEFENKYLLSMELPGYKKEDIKADLKDGYLTIAAEYNTNHDQQDENGKYIRRERYSGSCRRSFYVGEDVKKEEIQARFEDGVLKLELPKKDTPKVEESQYIAIE